MSDQMFIRCANLVVLGVFGFHAVAQSTVGNSSGFLCLWLIGWSPTVINELLLPRLRTAQSQKAER